ncbi:hypothetical protein IFM89_008705 [Coptis chinensis]|uniref:Transposase-associated domain-containing protein n=1 Tax=Coptis chinensis TaxID=261450 RepID=A0A835GYJ9_9MAGN|nr:hypothetical protein IFM89_008705 [Coptis chinensis]
MMMVTLCYDDEWKLGGKKCPCPCKKCRNRYWLTYKEVGYHLISKGIEKSYRVWTLHGEDLSNAAVHPPLVANIGEKTSDDDGFEMGDTEEETIGDVGIGMRNFVDSAFGLHGDAVAGDDSLGIEFDEPYVPEPDLGKSVLNDHHFLAKKVAGVLVESELKSQPLGKRIFTVEKFPQVKFAPYKNVDYIWNPADSTVTLQEVMP